MAFPLAGSCGYCGLSDPHGIYLPEIYLVFPPAFSICRILWHGCAFVFSPQCGEPCFSVLKQTLLPFFFIIIIIIFLVHMYFCRETEQEEENVREHQ